MQLVLKGVKISSIDIFYCIKKEFCRINNSPCFQMESSNNGTYPNLEIVMGKWAYFFKLKIQFGWAAGQ